MTDSWDAAASDEAHWSTSKADLSTPDAPMAKYAAASPESVPEADTPRFEFRKRAQFAWKVFTLFVTFVALIPVLYFQSALGAQAYLWFLVIVHVLGLFIFAVGVSREDIAPSSWGFYGRLIGLAVTVGLLYWVSQGLQTKFGTAAFWWSLFGIWAVHSAGLALLHLRGRRETACPFV